MSNSSAEKSRILFLATDIFSIGGIQRYSNYQIRALKSIDGVEKTPVFSLNGRRGDSFEEEYFADYEGGGAGFFSKIIFVLKALAAAKKEKINLVLCNHISLAPIALIAKRLWGIPYLVNVYGLEIWSGPREREIRALKEADGIIGDSKFILEYLKNNFSIPEEKLFLLYDCVDTDKFSPLKVPAGIYEKYGIPKNKKIISVVGRLVYDKGQETMIRFLKFLPKDAVLLVVGGGPRLEEWKNLAVKKGVAERAIFTGRVPEEDLPYLYNIQDVAVYLSEFKKNEGGALPLVLIEAAACGKPLVSSNEDGAAEAVKEGFNGFIVPPRDRDEITKKIKYLFSHPSVLNKMGKQSLEYAKDNFSYPIFKDKFGKILEEIKS